MRGYRFIKSSAQAVYYVYSSPLEALEHATGSHLVIIENLWAEPQQIAPGRYELSSECDPMEVYSENAEKLLHSFVLSIQSDRFDSGPFDPATEEYLNTYNEWIIGHVSLTTLIQAMGRALEIKNKTAWDIFSQDIHMQAQVLISAEVITYVTGAQGNPEYFIPAPVHEFGHYHPSYDFKRARLDVKSRLARRLEKLIEKARA